MPEGFEKQMTPNELRELLEFLTARGTFLPLDLSKVATISSGKPMFYGLTLVKDCSLTNGATKLSAVFLSS